MKSTSQIIAVNPSSKTAISGKKSSDFNFRSILHNLSSKNINTKGSGSVKPSSSKVSHGAQLDVGMSGFLVLIDRNVEKSSKINELYDLFEKFAPGRNDNTTKDSMKTNYSSNASMNEGTKFQSTIRVANSSATALCPNSIATGEIFGDGEHVTDSNSNPLGKTKSVLDDVEEEKLQKPSQFLSESSEETVDEDESVGDLSAFRKPGETDDEFVKRLAREEIQKYTNDEALMRMPPEISQNFDASILDSNDGNNVNLWKPQLNATETVFIPKLTYKPNAIKRLDLRPILNPKTRKFYYEHPYKDELDRWTPSPHLLHRSAESSWNYRKISDTPLVVVHTAGRLESMMRELQGVQELSFGVKISQLSYYGSCCAVTISTRFKNYVIDCFNLRGSLECLNKVFTDPAVLKIGHNVAEGLLYLQMDLGVYVVGLFDTGEAEKVLRDTKKSVPLAILLRKYFKSESDRSCTDPDANWSLRPLPKHMIEHARSETHFLLYLYEIKKAELLQRGSGEYLYEVYQASKDHCLARYDLPDRDLWVHKYKDQLTSQQFYALVELNAWRGSVALAVDKAPKLICSDNALLALAQALPSTIAEIRALQQRHKIFLTSYMERDKIKLVKIVSAGRALPLVSPELQNLKRLVVDQCLKTGVVGALFFKAKVPEHTEIVKKILDFYKENVFAVPNFVQQIIPVDITCQKDLQSIKDALKTLLHKSHRESRGMTFEIFSNFPYTKQHSLASAVSDAIAQVHHGWVYTENQGDVGIVVHSIRTTCCLSIVTDYEGYRKFYLRPPEGQFNQVA